MMLNLKNARTLLLTGFLLAWLLATTAVTGVAATFAFTGSLNTARYSHTATFLPNGQVLVAGGLDVNGLPLASAELYSPTTGKWTVTGSMSLARSYFTATLLSNGEVLVAGGSGTTTVLTSAELYNPATGKWTSTGSLTESRYEHSATLLQNGEVLVAGGLSPGAGAVATAELYSPLTGVWKPTGSLNVSRAQAAAVLENGEVLVASGVNYSNGIETILTSAEVYNLSTGLWSPVASMAKGNTSPSGVLLPNNDLLIANAAEFYNPAMNAWANTGAIPQIVAENPIRATLLGTGNVLASGTVCSYSGCGHVPTVVCFLYTTATNSWSVTGSMNQARIDHTSTLLANGKVLVVGGYSRGLGVGATILSSAELYTP
jgi:hypothetical protein